MTLDSKVEIENMIEAAAIGNLIVQFIDRVSDINSNIIVNIFLTLFPHE